ncbi:hypothetical protein FRC00_009081 [Tulasnella sp. 408]|nr:hypothetical protein FRC00_009081 [Tulasnella sp. 408]
MLNTPSRKDDEPLSTGFEFANSQAWDQERGQVATGKTAVVVTTVPEQAYLHGQDTRQ